MFHVCLYYTILSVPCSHVITCWERTDLLVLLCVMFPCVFGTFPYGVSGQVWYLIISTPDLCLPLYFLRFCSSQTIYSVLLNNIKDENKSALLIYMYIVLLLVDIKIMVAKIIPSTYQLQQDTCNNEK